MTYQTSDVNKYFNDDTVFNAINKNFVSLHENDITENNIHLSAVIGELLQRMKYEDTFFKEVYQRIVFSGSYYKKTKVGSPDEFDLDVVIKLPIDYDLIEIEPCYPGFVKIYSGLMPSDIDNIHPKHKPLKRLLNHDMYLNQEMYRRWMESIFHRTISKLPGTDDMRVLISNERSYAIKITKTGPAFTLHIHVDRDRVISVDLVPVLELSHKIRKRDCNLTHFQKTTWYAVPKPLDNFIFKGDKQLYWRTCFYEQEKEILSKNGKIKPVLRQIKKLRDTQKWKNMASYYIETLFLHVLKEYTNLERKSHTSLFMMMLEELHIALQKRCIPYYWDTNFNLLSRLKLEEIKNIERRLGNIITSIYRNIRTDKFIIAYYILTEEELKTLKWEIEDCKESVENETYSNSWKCTIL